MNLEHYKKRFKDHKATFMDFGNIKLLDFKNPECSDYRIRFLFEEDYCRLHISGDLGELIATNYYNMTYEKFGDFVKDTGYFEEKINCMSRTLYYYDEKKAREDLIKEIETDYASVYDFMDAHFIGEETIDDVLEEILADFEEDRGLSARACGKLEDYFYDVWDFARDIGRKRTDILEVYMLAFELATEQLKGGAE